MESHAAAHSERTLAGCGLCWNRIQRERHKQACFTYSVLWTRIIAENKGRTMVDAYGFPRGYCMRTKRVHGFATGDIVFAQIPKGKNKGEYIGRVAVREKGSFDLKTACKKIEGIS